MAAKVKHRSQTSSVVIIMATSGAELAAQLARMSPDVTKRRQVILLNQIAGTAELALQRFPTAAVVLVIIPKGMLRRESKLPWEKTVLFKRFINSMQIHRLTGLWTDNLL